MHSSGAFVTQLLQRFRHPEHGYRSCLGLLGQARRYGLARLEAACAIALGLGATYYRHVRDILANVRDLVAWPRSCVSCTATAASRAGSSLYARPRPAAPPARPMHRSTPARASPVLDDWMGLEAPPLRVHYRRGGRQSAPKARH